MLQLNTPPNAGYNFKNKATKSRKSSNSTKTIHVLKP